MGQGVYRGVGIGMLNPPSELCNDALLQTAADCLKFAYECEPEYAVVPAAVDDEALQEWEHLGPLPDWVPAVKDRTAVEVRDRCCLDRQRAVWELVRQAARTCGIELPLGQIIAYSDYD